MAARAQAMAAAEQSTEVKVAFAELVKLPVTQLKEKLSEGEYREVQALCQHLGISAKGQRSELERRIVEHVEVKSASEDPQEHLASPETRDGRNRSPKTGVAAATLRAAAPLGKAQSPTVAQFLADGSADAPANVLPDAPRLPGFVASSGAASASLKLQRLRLRLGAFAFAVTSRLCLQPRLQPHAPAQTAQSARQRVAGRPPVRPLKTFQKGRFVCVPFLTILRGVAWYQVQQRSHAQE